MARANLNQTSFTTGELSPRVLGRVDLERYFSALKTARNGHAVPQGGFVRRPGTRFAAECAAHTDDASILVEFISGRDQAWVLEFGENIIRVYNADRTYTGVELTGTGYAAAYLRQMDWVQSDNTLWIFSPYRPIARLQRLGSGTWVLSNAPFTTSPFAEVGIYGGFGITLSNVAVGAGRTATAGSALFLASDVGRGLIYDSGIAVITAVASATSATVEITRAFPNVLMPSNGWDMEGSPQSTVTPSAATPVGAAITLTASADSWRSRDVGAFVRINGGLCKITSLTSATIANAVIVRELAGTVASPPLAWSLNHTVWNDQYGYPRTGTVYQQRLIVGGTTKFPRTVWGSRLGETLDFEIGTTDDLAFSWTIDSDEASPIAYITSSPDLLVLTESGEYSVRGGVEKALSPTNVRIKPETGHGCAQVRPVFVGGESLFVQRAGRKVRSLAYRYDFDRYTAPDITSLAEHLTRDGVTCMTWQQEADPLLWCVRGDGSFLICLLDRDQQPSIVGWFSQDTDGYVEWVTSIPNGDRNQVWAIVRRPNGKRLIEVFDDTVEALHPDDVTDDNPVYGMTVDCGYVFSNGAGATVFSVPQLIGRTVDIVADGLVMPRQVVPGSGNVTLTRSAKLVQIGLPFRTEGQLLTPEMGSQAGTAQGTAQRSGKLYLRFLSTIGAKVVNDEGEEEQIPFQQFGDELLDQAPQPFTGYMEVTKLGWAKGRSELSVVQDLPLPMHLLAVTRRHTANEG